MLKNLEKIKQNGYWIFWGILVFVLFSFSTRKQKERTCEKIHIHIDNQMDNFFIEESDVLRLMKEKNKKIIKGLSKEALDINHFEELTKSNKFILESKVSIAHNGDIHVKIKENKPVARVFTKKGSFYIDKEGDKLPLSRNYTARIIVIHARQFKQSEKGDFFKEDGLKYTELVNFVNTEKFWKKQIAEIIINKKGKVTLHAQIGKEKIIFGKPEQIESKFQKLEVYYKKILPSVGWNKYKLVNLEFSEQIVCE